MDIFKKLYFLYIWCQTSPETYSSVKMHITIYTNFERTNIPEWQQWLMNRTDNKKQRGCQFVMTKLKDKNVKMWITQNVSLIVTLNENNTTQAWKQRGLNGLWQNKMRMIQSFDDDNVITWINKQRYLHCNIVINSCTWQTDLIFAHNTAQYLSPSPWTCISLA